MNDALTVVHAALAGSKVAFGKLVERHQSSLRRFLFYLCGDAEWSKDLAQETFIKAWLNVSTFRAVAGFRTWLFRIGYNVFYDAVRARKVHADVATLAEQIAAVAPNIDARIDCAAALQVLDEREKTAMLLFYMEDCTVAKIADIMGCPAGTVKSLLCRGREKVKRRMENGK